MSFTLDDHWVWDFWFADDGDTFHLFYLHAPKSIGDAALRHRNAAIGHATSTDLATWTNLGLALQSSTDPDEFDATATWTGSTVQGDDGIWRMFYTGAKFLPDGTNIETVGVATSTNLHDWTKRPGPITRADPRWYETLGTSTWPEEAWRDPWVYRDETDGMWHMLVTARSNRGPDDERGVIGHATSPDLDTWTVTAPLTSPGAGFAHMEVPQLLINGAERTLLFSCPTSALSEESQNFYTGGVWSTRWTKNNNDFSIATARLVADQALYSGRVIRDRTGQEVLLGFTNSPDDATFEGGIGDPLPFALCVG